MNIQNDVPNKRIAAYIFPLFTAPEIRRFTYIAACSAFVFTLFFIAPLDLYLNNTIEFNIGFADAALPLLAVSLIILAAGLLLLPLFFRETALDFMSVLLFLLTTAFYIQVLLLNEIIFKIFEGNGFDNNKSEITRGTINGFIFGVVIIILPLLIWKKYYNSRKYKKVKWETIIICALIIIIGMQLSGVAAALFKCDVNVEMPYYFSYDKAFELSSNENICVFMLDTLSVQYMDDVLEQYPGLNEKLDGFTFYQNNMSFYPATFPSVPLMLTGEYYDPNDKVKTYFEKAWTRYGFIDILRENGYNINLLLSKISFGNYRLLYNRADNITDISKDQIKINHYKIIEKTLRFSFEKVSPYGWKDFLTRNKADFSNEFYEWSAEDILPHAIGDGADILFYERLKTVGLSVRGGGNTFAFTHLNCSHDGGYHYNVETNKLEAGGTFLLSTYGSFRILNEYFTQMKKLGIYDNATIVVVADHGYHDGTARMRTASLLIKLKNSRGKLLIDKTSELSHINFGASILEAAELPHQDFGYSYFDIINGKLSQTREHIPFMLLEKDRFDKSTGKYHLPGAGGYKNRYKIIGDANNSDNWTYIELK